MRFLLILLEVVGGMSYLGIAVNFILAGRIGYPDEKPRTAGHLFGFFMVAVAASLEIWILNW